MVEMPTTRTSEKVPEGVTIAHYYGANILPALPPGGGPDTGGTTVRYVNGVPQCPNDHGSMVKVGRDPTMPFYWYCLTCRIALHRHEWLIPPPPYGPDLWDIITAAGEEAFPHLKSAPATEYVLSLFEEVADFGDLVRRDAGWGYKPHTSSTVEERLDALADVPILVVRNAVKHGFTKQQLRQAIAAKMARVRGAMAQEKAKASLAAIAGREEPPTDTVAIPDMRGGRGVPRFIRVPAGSSWPAVKTGVPPSYVTLKPPVGYIPFEVALQRFRVGKHRLRTMVKKGTIRFSQVSQGPKGGRPKLYVNRGDLRLNARPAKRGRPPKVAQT